MPKAAATSKSSSTSSNRVPNVTVKLSSGEQRAVYKGVSGAPYYNKGGERHYVRSNQTMVKQAPAQVYKPPAVNVVSKAVKSAGAPRAMSASYTKAQQSVTTTTTTTTTTTVNQQYQHMKVKAK